MDHCVVFEKKDYVVSAFHPFEKILAVGDTSGHITIVDVTDHKQTKILKKIEDGHTAAVTCIAFHPSGAHLVTAAQDNNVCYYSTENWEYLGLLTRTENMISHVAFDADGKYLSISAKEDNKLKILNVAHLAYPVKDTNKTVTQHILNDSEGGVRFSAFDPKGEFFASLGHDNSIRIWNVSDIEKTGASPVHTVPGAVHTSIKFLWAQSELNVMPVSFAWSFSGDHLVVPGMKSDANKVAFLKRNTWKEDSNNSITDLKKAYQASFSSNGLYLAIADEENLTVYDMSNEAKRDAAKKTILFREKTSALLSSVSWHCNEDILMTSDISGFVKNIVNFIGELPSSHKRSAIPWLMSEMNDLGDLSFDSIEDSDKQPVSGTGEDADSDEEMEEEKPEKKEEKEEQDEDSEEEEEESDEDSEEEEEEPKQKPQLTKIASPIKQVKQPSPKAVEPVVAKFESQSSFQPASTEFAKYGDQNKRLLAHNYVGIIAATDKGTEYSIEIEYHNSSKYRSERFSDKSKSSMGAIGESGVILANASSCSVRLTLEISNVNWSHTMTENETIDAVAIGKDFAAVATTSTIQDNQVHNVRIYSVGGIHRFSLSVASRVVAMNAKNDQLVIVYQPTPLHMYQLLSIAGAGAHSLKHEPLPIAVGKTTVQWIGFSHPNDSLAVLDSNGLLRMLSIDCEGWVIVLDMNTVPSKSGQRTYFVSSITDEHVMCHVQGPVATVPRPTMEAVLFAPSVTSLASKVSKDVQSWEKQLLVRSQILNQKKRRKLGFSESSETELDKSVMLLFNAALNDKNQERCFELCQMLHRPKALDMAIEYSSKAQMSALVQRLRQLKGNKPVVPNDSFYGRPEPVVVQAPAPVVVQAPAPAPAPVVVQAPVVSAVESENAKKIEALQKQVDALLKQVQGNNSQLESLAKTLEKTVDLLAESETPSTAGTQEPFSRIPQSPKKQPSTPPLFSPKRPKKGAKNESPPKVRANPFLTTEVKPVLINPNANNNKASVSVLDKLDQMAAPEKDNSQTKKRKREDKENDSVTSEDQPAQKKHLSNSGKTKTLSDFMTKKAPVLPKITEGGLGAKAQQALKNAEQEDDDDDDLPEVTINN